MTATCPPTFGKPSRRQPPLAAAPGEPLYLITYDYHDRAIGRCTGTADLSLNQQSRRDVAEQIARGLIPGAERVFECVPANAAPTFPRISPATPWVWRCSSSNRSTAICWISSNAISAVNRLP